ncbi:MAG TPA: transporter [Vicinamibacterales bacterium]|nr:transporter [Vicinamibacterales bacterium]
MAFTRAQDLGSSAWFRSILATALLGTTALSATAQSSVEPAVIAANRPGFGETTEVAGRGILQLESGVIFDTDRMEGVETKTMSAPVSLLRLGVSRRVEIQVASEGIFSRSVATPAGRGRISGPADIDFGVKAKLASESAAGVSIAVLGAVNMPIGATAFSSGSYDPSLKVAFGRSLPRRVSIGGNLQLASTTLNGRRVFQHAISAAAARAVTARWSVFGEVYRISTAPGAPAITSVDAGVSRIVGNHLQLDASAGRGISRTATDWFVALGFAVRRPHLFGRRP